MADGDLTGKPGDGGDAARGRPRGGAAARPVAQHKRKRGGGEACTAPRFSEAGASRLGGGGRNARAPRMRQVVRPEVRLPTLIEIEVKHGEGWKATGVGGPPDGLWNNPDVRGALYAMHGRACAYCEQHLPENDRGDVEHFRPESLYRWLAYAFDNYLLSCSICNRTLKRDRFPLRSGATRC